MSQSCVDTRVLRLCSKTRIQVRTDRADTFVFLPKGKENNPRSLLELKHVTTLTNNIPKKPLWIDNSVLAQDLMHTSSFRPHTLVA